jgi:hypothetical protein
MVGRIVDGDAFRASRGRGAVPHPAGQGAGSERGARPSRALHRADPVGSPARRARPGAALRVDRRPAGRARLHDTTLDWAENLLEALASSGRSGTDLLVAFRTVTGFVMGVVQAQLTQPAVDATDPDIARAQALPPERYPRLIEIAKAAARLGPDREFRAGFDIVMAGLTAS